LNVPSIKKIIYSNEMLFRKKHHTKLENRIWWAYVHHDIQELLKESELLVEHVGKWKNHFHDYAFVVFPAAKAYEGFLKKLFYDLEFITQEDYYGKRFRIGRALNPALEPRFRELESVYDKLIQYCHGEELPEALWQMWKKGRNMSFHWFPEEKNAITFAEAKKIVYEIFDTMDLAFVGCKIDKNKPIIQ
jgi:hypothetical protein